jgi:dTDP-4-dehydrorhamnose reductase
MTRLELAQATAKAFDFDEGLIQVGPPDPAESSSMKGIPIPRDTSLDSSYSAERLAYRPPDVAEALAKLWQQMETGRL